MNKIEHSAEKWIEKGCISSKLGKKVWVKALSNYSNPFEDAFL
jgi:hypothetical protein